MVDIPPGLSDEIMKKFWRKLDSSAMINGRELLDEAGKDKYRAMTAEDKISYREDLNVYHNALQRKTWAPR